MIDIILQVLICGISTAAICRTIVYYDGPFHVFPRMKALLLPKGSGIYRLGYRIRNIDDLQESFSKILMESQAADGEREMWKVYHTTYNPKFYRSLKGTLYNVLDCPFCLGPYISALMASLSTGYMMSIRPIGWHNLISGLLIAFGSYGLHFLISKKWEA